MTRTHSIRAGFTVLELMVVIVLLAIVTVHVLGVFSSQMQTYQTQKAVVETQDDARLVADLIFYDVRMAGFMVPTQVAIAGIDGNTTDPDALCVSDSAVLNEQQVDDADARFDGASLTGNVVAGAGSVTVNAGEMDIDGDGDSDFAKDSGIIISEGNANHCAVITGITGSAISFLPVTPGGFAANTPGVRVVPAVVYASTANGLTRNGLVVSQQVEDLQVEYGVDDDGDGQLDGTEWPLDGLNGHDASAVRIVRLSVLTRTVGEDPNLEGPGRQGVANRDPSGTPDHYRRRLVTVSAAPRNLM